MKKIIGIEFKGGGRIYYFDCLNEDFIANDLVVVETIRGIELGKVVLPTHEVDETKLENELKPIIRRSTKEDVAMDAANEALARESFKSFVKHVKACSLDMKPIAAEYTLDKAKVIFYYTADERVDFRELLKVLTQEFRVRIELRQIGPREAARYIGGIGGCGQAMCCVKYLRDFDFVTMKMAKEQSMSLNVNKISGMCGKLMCCIAYEKDLYKEIKKEMPPIGSLVKTPTCDRCKVVGLDLVKRLIKTAEQENELPKVHPLQDVQMLTKKVVVEETNDEE